MDVTANTVFILRLHELVPFNPIRLCHAKASRAKVQSEDSSLHFLKMYQRLKENVPTQIC